MEYIIAGIAILLLLRRPKSLRWQAALAAVRGKTFYRSNDFGMYADLEPLPTARLIGNSGSIFYWRTEHSSGQVTETIDMIASGYNGGIKISYRDEEVLGGIWNGLEFNKEYFRFKQEAKELLTAVRYAVANSIEPESKGAN